MAFGGWPEEAIEFFEGLEADNSRMYWLANKDTYERAIRGPMQDLLDELGPHYSESRIFRPNRDIRFSADKSPYKTNIAAMLAGSGYVSFSAEGLGVGCGYYMMAADQLERYRRAVADVATGERLAGIVEAARAAGLEVSGHDVLKTAPRGYPKDHPRVELLRYKGLTTWRHWSPEAWLGTSEAKERVAEVLEASRPLLSWLDAEVGPSTNETAPHGR